jgi:predicted nucleotide-binding protein
LPSVDNRVNEAEKVAAALPKSAVFLVHGHDEGVLQAVARFLEQLGLQAIVLREQPDSGRTIIEKFEHYADQVGFAVILLTPDDVAGKADAPGSALRARQNVIFELGFFAGKLGRGRACLLKKGDIEIPSDLYGVIYKAAAGTPMRCLFFIGSPGLNELLGSRNRTERCGLLLHDRSSWWIGVR